MNIYRISAVTLIVKNMEKSCTFYSRLPGFHIVYGGRAADSFTTFEVGKGSKIYINLELTSGDNGIISANDTTNRKVGPVDFGRIIFHCEDLDNLYLYMRNDKAISEAITFENEPADAPWGERFFHVREPDGYELSFAQPFPSGVQEGK